MPANWRWRAWKKRLTSSELMASWVCAWKSRATNGARRMQAEAISLGAQGVVGTQIHERSHGWGSHIIEFFAVGTAVISISDTHQVPAPSLALLLND